MHENNTSNRPLDDRAMCGATVHYLTAGEPEAPASALSPAKRTALIACLRGRSLCKQRGFWMCPDEINLGRRIAGVTVADLARDGMLNIVWIGKRAIARLSARGSWYARTIASTMTELPH